MASLNGPIPALVPEATMILCVVYGSNSGTTILVELETSENVSAVSITVMLTTYNIMIPFWSDFSGGFQLSDMVLNDTTMPVTF